MKSVNLQKRKTLVFSQGGSASASKKNSFVKPDKDRDEKIQYIKQNFGSDKKTLNVILLIGHYKNKLKLNLLSIENSITNSFIVKEILKSMKKLKVFSNFFSFYKIDDKLVAKTIPSMNINIIKKGNYVYREGDLPFRAYLFLKGNLSFRKTKYEESNEIEIEKFVLNSQKFFAVDEVIASKKINYSIFSLEDCFFLSLDKEVVKKNFEEKILKTETDKKVFLLHIFNKFVSIPSVKLERFIQYDVENLFFSRGEIIYEEGEDNYYLYIIYDGEANLIKNIKEIQYNYINKFGESMELIKEKASNIRYLDIVRQNKEPITYNLGEEKKLWKNQKNILNESKLDILLNINNYYIVETLSKGSIGGLEITTGNVKTKYSLISTSNFTSVFKVDLRFFEIHLKELMLNLLPLFVKLEKQIYLRIKNKKIVSKKLIPKSLMTTKKNKTKLYINEEGNDKIYKNNIQRINESFDLNEGGFIKNNEYNKNLQIQRNIFKEKIKENVTNRNKILNILQNISNEEKINLKFTEFKFKKFILKKEIENLISNNKNDNLKIKPLKFLSKSNSLNKYSSVASQNDKSKSKFNTPKNSYSNQKLDDTQPKKKLIKKLFLRNQYDFAFTSIINNNNDVSPRISVYDDKKEKVKEDINAIKQSLSIDDNYMKNVLIYREEDKIKNLKYGNSFDGKSNLNKKNNIEENTFSFFHSERTKKEKSIYNIKCAKGKKFGLLKKAIFYDTGKFDIPLLSKLNEK